MYIDGVDLTELEPRWYHRQVALVSQEPVLFSGTIGENIKYGRDDAKQSDIIEAAKAGIYHFFFSRSFDLLRLFCYLFLKW